MPNLNDKQDFEVTQTMEDAVQKRLDAIPATTEEDLIDIPQLDKKEKEVIEEDDTEVEEDIEEVEDDTEVEEDESKDEENELPPLPENYYRAAIHCDWTPEEIQDFYQSNPEQASKTFGKMLESTNATSQVFSDFGRVQLKQTQDALRAEQDKQNAARDEFKGMDVEAIEKQFGESDPAVVAVLKAMNEQNRAFHEEISEIRKSQTGSQAEEKSVSDEQTKLWHDIDGFFSDKDLKVYDDFYGVAEKDKTWDQVLTGEQARRRMDVICMADEIRAGAALKGTEINPTEAMQRAHLFVSNEVRDKVIRDDLRSKTKKRSDGITVKSTGRKPKQEDEVSGKKNEKAMEKRTKGRLSKLFGGHVE